jgi:hypothetical protein
MIADLQVERPTGLVRRALIFCRFGKVMVAMPEATDATLTRIEKNGVFELVVKFGPPPSEFCWTEKQEQYSPYVNAPTYRVSVLTHQPTGYYCVFGAHALTLSPGLSEKVEFYKHREDVRQKIERCAKWLIDLKAEAEAPDLWASIIDEKSLSEAASSTLDNQPFSSGEQVRIGSALDDIKRYLLEGQQFNVKQAEFVEQEFSYLRESAKRFGRKDWLRLLLSVLIGQVISLALAPEKAKGLLHMAGAALQWVWGVAHQLN